ncbi:MAG: hydrolase, partial [Prochlorococcus sp.]
MAKLRAVFWDVDGTLADTEMEGHRVAFNEAFAAGGFPWQWDRQTYG